MVNWFQQVKKSQIKPRSQIKARKEVKLKVGSSVVYMQRKDWSEKGKRSTHPLVFHVVRG